MCHLLGKVHRHNKRLHWRSITASAPNNIKFSQTNPTHHLRCPHRHGADPLSPAPSPLQAIEESLDKVVKLLAYISDKDLFAEFYRKRLSKRLLQDRSASDDLERTVLSRLKQQCGAQFTSKVGEMPLLASAARCKHRTS